MPATTSTRLAVTLRLLARPLRVCLDSQLFSQLKAIANYLTADATKVRHVGQNDASKKGTEVRKDAEVLAADAGKEVDRLAAQARDGTHKVDQKLEEYRRSAEKNLDSTIQKTGAELNKAVDAFDKNVSEVSLEHQCVKRPVG